MFETKTNLTEAPSHYDILDLRPDASPQEIREAYLRAKAAFNKDSVAIYTLIEPLERDQTIQRIEEAYEVLSHPERRKEYDRRHGHLGATDQLLDSMPNLWPNQRKIISIDRVPPMEANLREEEVLVAPNTDFNPNAAAAGLATPLPSEPEPAASENSDDSSPTPANARPKPATIDEQVRELVELEAEWGGGFFRRLRELRRLSIEEVANLTKISKTYLSAIEAETFEKLPAPVFVRGFVTQLCRTLKIPSEKAAPGYMTRFLQARPEQK